jgi:hypothetical protein
MAAPSPDWVAFFDHFHHLHHSPPAPLHVDKLRTFLGGFHRLHPATVPAPVAAPRIQAQQLATFFLGLQDTLQASRYNALAFNPWEVMRLGRNEVRVVSILAWLLDPKASHGLGPVLLNALLSQLGPDFAHAGDGRCQVRTEIHLQGSNSDRVDIEIDGEKMYLIIEAKIDAPEQEHQIARYCRQAHKQASQHSRPWKVIYLTCNQRSPTWSDDDHRRYAPHIANWSWHALAQCLAHALQTHQNQRMAPSLPIQAHADFFVRSYLQHVQSL